MKINNKEFNIKVFYIFKIIKMSSTSESTKEKRELNKIELKDIFKNFKSDYFLQKIFNNLMKKKSLDIIKYNKNIKERMNISIKDYKENIQKYIHQLKQK